MHGHDTCVCRDTARGASSGNQISCIGSAPRERGEKGAAPGPINTAASARRCRRRGVRCSAPDQFTLHARRVPRRQGHKFASQSLPGYWRCFDLFRDSTHNAFRMKQDKSNAFFLGKNGDWFNAFQQCQAQMSRHHKIDVWRNATRGTSKIYTAKYSVFGWTQRTTRPA